MKIKHVFVVILAILTMGIATGCSFVSFNDSSSVDEEAMGEQVADAEAWAAAFADCKDNWSLVGRMKETEKDASGHFTEINAIFEVKKEGNKSWQKVSIMQDEKEHVLNECYLLNIDGAVYEYDKQWKKSYSGFPDDDYLEEVVQELLGEKEMEDLYAFESYTYTQESGEYVYHDIGTDKIGENSPLNKGFSGKEITTDILLKVKIQGGKASLISIQLKNTVVFFTDGENVGTEENNTEYVVTFNNVKVEIPEFDLEKIESSSRESSESA